MAVDGLSCSDVAATQLWQHALAECRIPGCSPNFPELVSSDLAKVMSESSAIQNKSFANPERIVAGLVCYVLPISLWATVMRNELSSNCVKSLK